MNKRILFVLLLCFEISLLYGQKDVYSLESGEVWENLYLRGISKNKKWIDYYTNTNLGDIGVSYIKEISTDSIFKFRKGYWGKFSENGKWYSIKVGKDSLILVDLVDYKHRIYRGIKSHNFTVNGYVVLHNNSDILTLLNDKTQIVAEMDKISNYSLHPNKDLVAAIKNTMDDSTVIIYDLVNQSSKELSLANYINISHVSWDSDGKYLIGFGQNSQSNEVEIWCYDKQKRTTRFLKNNHFELKRNNERIIRSKLLSHSGDKILFHTEIKDTILSGVYEAEEWDTSCSTLNICKHKINSDQNDDRLNVWEPKTDKILSLYNSNYPIVAYNDRNSYGIMYSSEESEPHFNFYPFVSLQAFDVKSRSISKIVDQQYLGMTYLHYSPSGNYLLYFKNNHWWLYVFKEHQHYNLTKEIKSDFYDEDLSFKLSTSFGFGGWTEDESVIYLYDKYDIWKVNVKSKKSKKLTDGTASNAVYRIISHGLKQKVYDISNFESNIIDSTKKIIVKAIVQDTLDEYVYILTDKEELKLLVGGSKRIFNLHQINENNYVYQEESLTSPTTIQLKSLKDSGSQTLVESNKNWNQYDWSKTKLFYYPLNERDSVRSLLVYPAAYNPNKSYPMIVYVYEKQSTYLHKFLPPTYFNDIGFNILNYSINDYFVLLPDIHYEITQVGMSAVKCVESSVKKALTLGNIDKNKIGLIGHSFGGYETAYIITQSSLFKAAVAGAGVYDLTSFNFDIFKMTGQPEIMRTENIPFRMKNSYYEYPENYLKNSPIHHFSQVNTPLLVWSGKNDLNVNPQQSIEGFLGLYRLRKPAKLLLYPNEGHSLLNNNNRKELTKRIKEWFDNYLN